MYDSLVELENVFGKTVRVTVDEPGQPDPRGIVILAPPFGATAHSMFPFAYAMTMNGYRVARLDFTDHVGLSDGEIIDAAMSTKLVDLRLALDAFPGAVIVAVSLSSRIALRALAEPTNSVGAVLITPVVDVRYTLERALDGDFFGMEPEELPHTLRVFEHPIAGSFVTRSRAAGFFDLTDGARDLSKVGVPCRLIAGDNDPWVSIDSLGEAMQGVDRCQVQLETVPAGTHKLNRNPAVARVYIDTMLTLLFRLQGRGGGPDVPSIDQMIHAMSAARTNRSRMLARL